MKALYPDSIALLLRRRWPIMSPGVSFTTVNFTETKEFLKQLSPAWATSILKTWSNSWTTSHRLHEQILRPCVFGCHGEVDTLHHYLRCRQLWQLLCPAPLREPSSFAQRLLLVGPSSVNALNLVIAFLTYNSVKHRARMLSGHRLECEVDAARSHALCSANRATLLALNAAPLTRIADNVTRAPPHDQL